MDRWMKVSYPFFKVEQIKTPTMFMAGEKDFNVPAIGSEQMYQALKSVGTPTRLVIYPGPVPRHHSPQLPAPSTRAVGAVVRHVREGHAGHDAAPADTDGERGALGGCAGARGSYRPGRACNGRERGWRSSRPPPRCGSASRILFLMMGVVLSIIPFAGMLWSVVVPIHAGGLMLGCRALRQGQPLEVRYLFNGFEAPRLQPLALVGALYLAGSLIVMLPIILLVVGGTMLSAFAVGSSGASATSLAGVGLVGVVIVLLVMAAVMVLSLALWFAPALVVFDDVPALEALKASLRAGWVNVGAFTVYGLVLIGVGVVAASPLIAAILLAAARGEQAGPFAVRRHRRNRALHVPLHAAADAGDMGRDVRQLRGRLRTRTADQGTRETEQVGQGIQRDETSKGAGSKRSAYRTLPCHLRSDRSRSARLCFVPCDCLFRLLPCPLSLVHVGDGDGSARGGLDDERGHEQAHGQSCGDDCGNEAHVGRSERHAAEQAGVEHVDAGGHRPPTATRRRNRVGVMSRAEPQMQTQGRGDRGEADQREVCDHSPATGQRAGHEPSGPQQSDIERRRDRLVHVPPFDATVAAGRDGCPAVQLRDVRCRRESDVADR